MQSACVHRIARSCAAIKAVRGIPFANATARRNVTSRAGGAVVSTEAAPAALGPYSQAVKAGSTLYISGQIGFDPSTMEFAGESVESQTTQVMTNLEAILEAGGGSFQNVVKTTVLLADMGDFGAVNEIYAKAFEGMEPPARACFAVKTLPKNALVEIEAIAEIP